MEALTEKYGVEIIRPLFKNELVDTSGQTPFMVACKNAAMNPHLANHEIVAELDPALKFILYLLDEFKCDINFKSES